MPVPLLPLVFGGAVVAGIVKRVIATIGLGIVSYTGFGVILTQLSGVINNNLGSLGEIACLLSIPQAAQLVLAAYSVRLALIPLKAWRVL